MMMKQKDLKMWKLFITGRLQEYAVEGIDAMKVKVLISMLDEFFEELEETADDTPQDGKYNIEKDSN